VAELLSRFARGFVLVMDGWTVHRGGVEILRRRFSRLDVEWLSAYAPGIIDV